MKSFISAINTPFSVNHISKYANTKPIVIGNISDMNLGDVRVNRFMIKNNDDIYPSLPGMISSRPDICNFIDSSVESAKSLGLDVQKRYWFLTIDKGIISDEKPTLREPGWHIDGMQGQEIPIKKDGDFQFIWSNILTTEFCKQEFNVEGLNPDIHNVFNFLSRQVNDVFSFEEGSVILMHCYHVHRCQEFRGTEPVLRKFIRFSFTNTPITSTKMTINESIKYNYPIHQTTGDIPSNLL